MRTCYIALTETSDKNNQQVVTALAELLSFTFLLLRLLGKAEVRCLEFASISTFIVEPLEPSQTMEGRKEGEPNMSSIVAELA